MFQKSFLLLTSPEPHKSVSILTRYFLHFTNKEYKPRDMKYLAESNAVSQAFRNGNQSDYFGSGNFWTAWNEFCFILVETEALHLRLFLIGSNQLWSGRVVHTYFKWWAISFICQQQLIMAETLTAQAVSLPRSLIFWEGILRRFPGLDWKR